MENIRYDLIKKETDKQGNQRFIIDMDGLKEELGRKEVIEIADENLGISVRMLSSRLNPEEISTLALKNFDSIISRRKLKEGKPSYLG